MIRQKGENPASANGESYQATFPTMPHDIHPRSENPIEGQTKHL